MFPDDVLFIPTRFVYLCQDLVKDLSCLKVIFPEVFTNLKTTKFYYDIEMNCDLKGNDLYMAVVQPLYRFALTELTF